jgi:hypothetical protein
MKKLISTFSILVLLSSLTSYKTFAAPCLGRPMVNTRTFECGSYVPCDEHGDYSPPEGWVSGSLASVFCDGWLLIAVPLVLIGTPTIILIRRKRRRKSD